MKSAFRLTFLLWVLSCSAALGQYKLYEKGTNSYNAAKYDEAIANLHAFQEKWSHDKANEYDIYYMLGTSYFKKGDYLRRFCFRQGEGGLPLVQGLPGEQRLPPLRFRRKRRFRHNLRERAADGR